MLIVTSEFKNNIKLINKQQKKKGWILNAGG